MSQKTGIICASDTELEPFLPHIQNGIPTEKAMLNFWEGTINGVNTVLVYSGVCKVNAAIAAQLLIDCFQVSRIINAGTAGGMDPAVRIFDTVISEQLAYHDVSGDVLTEFHPWLTSVYFHADEGLLSAARKIKPPTDFPVLFGTSVTGEQFIEDDCREEINQSFSPLSVDMEAAAIAHVCHANRIPFLSIRTVTDTADHSGNINFQLNCEKASAISKEITLLLLEELKRSGQLS